jgi:hypothetical protein
MGGGVCWAWAGLGLVSAVRPGTAPSQAPVAVSRAVRAVTRGAERRLRAVMIPAMTELITTRDWLTVYHLASYAHELNPAERVWSNLDQSVPSLAKRNVGEFAGVDACDAFRSWRSRTVGGCPAGLGRGRAVHSTAAAAGCSSETPEARAWATKGGPLAVPGLRGEPAPARAQAAVRTRRDLSARPGRAAGADPGDETIGA